MEVFCRMTTVRRADLSCVVQAGGLSSRMGCDKARMAFCGEPLIERVLGRLAPVAGELVVTTSRPSELVYLEERTFGGLVPRVVADLEGPAGAMRGIASSLTAARLPLVAIVACDMPFVSPELIGALADRVEAEALDVCVPCEERGIEPLCAVWRRDACAPVAHELLACDRQRIRCLINRVQAGYMDEPQIVKVAGSTLCFENVNTPEEFAAAELLASTIGVAMSHDICPDTGEPCTCDGSEPCTCGCGGCGHTAEEEAAAAAYREAHREGPSGDALDHERKIIVSFDSTFDVMECEQLCLAAGVPGRIMPLPGSITAGCGLCWAMPFSGDALAAFRAATEGRITPADYHQLVL